MKGKNLTGLTGCIGILLALSACSDGNYQVGRTSDSMPAIFPDYADVTIPCNIAPLCFSIADSCTCEQAFAVFAIDGKTEKVKARNGQFHIPLRAWKRLLEQSAGKTMQVTLTAMINRERVSYPSFKIHIAAEPADPYIAYRLIEPGYEVWNSMGIYQRNIENFDETAIVTNEHTKYNCMNCHSFCMQNPEMMLFHYRETFAGTMLLNGDVIEKLNTKTPETMSALTYPSWHPSGKYVAFSTNRTMQAFHTSDRNRIEVYDNDSDVAVYDVNSHKIVTAPQLSSEKAFETFPTFSPDGKTLYFCSADSTKMPKNYRRVQYSLCAVSFDPERCSFGAQVDTLYSAKEMNASVSFPRVSPDGRFLMFTLSRYGNFSVWHRDADLYLLHLDSLRIVPLNRINSSDTESYHSWSSNSRWVVFSSRRIDGLYTRLYLAHIDEHGQASKPFLLPQKDVDFYGRFMKSYNVPEFITGKVRKNSYDFSRKAINDKGIQVSFEKRAIQP
ncbi:MAG: hypothetical protein LBH60_05185 [Prevotellaceae bacterium]|jgi:hypothetical protein|nr:hypothetical protein [Prevotellaceae bacterium]